MRYLLRPAGGGVRGEGCWLHLQAHSRGQGRTEGSLCMLKGLCVSNPAFPGHTNSLQSKHIE